jgi:hypothetical protein
MPRKRNSNATSATTAVQAPAGQRSGEVDDRGVDRNHQIERVDDCRTVAEIADLGPLRFERQRTAGATRLIAAFNRVLTTSAQAIAGRITAMLPLCGSEETCEPAY